MLLLPDSVIIRQLTCPFSHHAFFSKEWSWYLTAQALGVNDGTSESPQDALGRAPFSSDFIQWLWICFLPVFLFSSLMKPTPCSLSLQWDSWGSSQNVTSPSSSSCSQLLSLFLSSHHQFLISSCLEIIFVCLKCLSALGHMLLTPLFHFSFPSEPDMAQAEWGSLAPCSLGPGNN